MKSVQRESVRSIANFLMLTLSLRQNRELRLNELGVLIYALEHPNTTPTMLKDFFRIPKPSVTSLLNPLEKKKYITRKVSTDDRRVSYVIPTAKAKAAVENVYAEYERYVSQFAKHVGEEKVTEFNEMITLAIHLIDNR